MIYERTGARMIDDRENEGWMFMRTLMRDEKCCGTATFC